MTGTNQAPDTWCCRVMCSHTWRVWVAVVPAVDEVGHGVVDAEGGGVQVSADLHIVSCHEANRRLVLLVKHLPLKRGTQQQHEVVWRGRGVR